MGVLLIPLFFQGYWSTPFSNCVLPFKELHYQETHSFTQHPGNGSEPPLAVEGK